MQTTSGRVLLNDEISMETNVKSETINTNKLRGKLYTEVPKQMTKSKVKTYQTIANG